MKKIAVHTLDGRKGVVPLYTSTSSSADHAAIALDVLTSLSRPQNEGKTTKKRKAVQSKQPIQHVLKKTKKVQTVSTMESNGGRKKINGTSYRSYKKKKERLISIIDSCTDQSRIFLDLAKHYNFPFALNPNMLKQQPVAPKRGEHILPSAVPTSGAAGSRAAQPPMQPPMQPPSLL